MATNAMGYHMINKVISQTVATKSETQVDTSSHCEQSKMSISESLQETVNDISKQNQNMECCDHDCQCSVSGCATFATYISTSSVLPIDQTSNKVCSIEQIISNQVINSLYRPPISC